MRGGGGEVTLGEFSTEKMTRLAREPSVAEAIERGEIYVDLQPIVELATGDVYGYEALARCRVTQLASPYQLFRAAEEQRALLALGNELRRLAVAATRGHCLFLNVHPAELDHEDMIAPDDPLAGHTGGLVVEIPEGSPLLRYRFAHTNFAALRSRGARVALDDFGAGYSNFGYIAQLCPEIVKVDREMIADVALGTRRQVLLGSLNDLCRAQGALVVAEGIETADELASVRAAGIALGQGYLLGRPSATGAVDRAAFDRGGKRRPAPASDRHA